MKPSKAIRESGCGPDLFQAAPSQFARLYHPLFVKSVVFNRLGTPCNIGMTHPLAKRPLPTCVNHMRDVRLEDPPIKKLGSWIRQAARLVIESSVADTQFGSG